MTRPKTRPKMGEDWNTLWTVALKLSQHGTLTVDEQDWLFGLLNALGSGEDVSKRFLAPATGRPSLDERYYWMALDIARLRSEGDPDAYATAGERWNLAPESIQRTLTRKRLAPADLPIYPLILIDYHRKRLMQGR